MTPEDQELIDDMYVASLAADLDEELAELMK